MHKLELDRSAELTCDPSVLASVRQSRTRGEVARFVDEHVAPFAGSWDRAARTPPEMIRRLARAGYLGAVVPASHGGMGLDWLGFGMLNEELGRGCSSLRSLLTVHSMVCHTLLRWGTTGQREHWLRRLATGDAVAAFALSEPNAGSDASGLESTAELHAGCYVLNGTKTWTTYGQIADLLLVFAHSNGEPIALLVERETAGLDMIPLGGMTGTRAAMLAELRFHDALVPEHARIAGPGFGMMIARAALEIGRLSVAFGCSGIIRACLDAARTYAVGREQFGVAIGEHQLVRRMLTDMAVNAQAAHLLCQRAAWSLDAARTDASRDIAVAKYFASTAAVRSALDACQVHGARGCSDHTAVDRLLRDARVAEVIEGSTQIQQITIAGYELERARREQSTEAM